MERFDNFTTLIRWIIIALLIILILPLYILAQENPLNAPKLIETEQTQKTKWGAVWRSAVFPGWGHIYKGEKKKGIKIAVIEGILVSGAYLTWQMSEQTYDKYLEVRFDPDYSNSETEIKKYYDEANLYHRISDYIILGAAFLWIYGIGDCWLARNNNSVENWNPIKWSFVINKEDINLEVRVSKYF